MNILKYICTWEAAPPMFAGWFLLLLFCWFSGCLFFLKDWSKCFLWEKLNTIPFNLISNNFTHSYLPHYVCLKWPKKHQIWIKGKNLVWNLSVTKQSLKSMFCHTRKKGSKPQQRMFPFSTYLSLPSLRMHLHMPFCIALLATSHFKLWRDFSQVKCVTHVTFKVLHGSKLLKNYIIIAF